MGLLICILVFSVNSTTVFSTIVAADYGVFDNEVNIVINIKTAAFVGRLVAGDNRVGNLRIAVVVKIQPSAHICGPVAGNGTTVDLYKTDIFDI